VNLERRRLGLRWLQTSVGQTPPLTSALAPVTVYGRVASESPISLSMAAGGSSGTRVPRMVALGFVVGHAAPTAERGHWGRGRLGRPGGARRFCCGAAEKMYASVDELAMAMLAQMARLAGDPEFLPLIRGNHFKPLLSGLVSTVQGLCRVTGVTILLDTGAAHCSISACLAAVLGLPRLPSGQQGPLSVATAAAGCSLGLGPWGHRCYLTSVWLTRLASL
jgi:hypothetical protein